MEKKYNFKRRGWQYRLLCLSFLLCCVFVGNVTAQEALKKKTPLSGSRSVDYSLPSGYGQVGSTLLYHRQSSSSIDFIGLFDSRYYGSTYSNGGYKVAMQVGNNSATSVDCLNGTTNNGVIFNASVEEQGGLARVCYTLTNTNEVDVNVSLGVRADVMIGNNDWAPISRRIDTFGNTYGLTLMDGNGAQLCVLFGSGLSGVTAANDFWFGHYYTNTDSYQMVGNYSSGDNWMQENSSYDSGMGWCWKNRTIAVGSTMVFSWLIGVGDVKLEPNSSFEVTPDDPDGWNDLSRPHRLTLDGLYESPAGLSGVIDYAVEDSEEWIALTDTLESGDTFRDTLVATFTPNKEKHIIRFRTRDLVGNTTMLPPIEYLDVSYYPVSGIEDKVYTGDSLFQTNLVCDMESEQYIAKNYHNNVNAGVASFNVEGVFPYTIGRRAYNFTINPATLEGEVIIADSNFIYNGNSQIPEWSFTETVNDTLKIDVDYNLVLTDNILPGEATLSIVGKGNYTGLLSSVFNIDKAPLTDNLYWLELPEADITYDELPHGASIQVAEGVGEATLSYFSEETLESSTEKPSSPGNYTIHLEIADGSLYYGKALTQVGSFCIYQFDETEWILLQGIHASLVQRGWSQPWDLSQGIKCASTLQGLTIKEGHVCGINLRNMNLSGEFPVELLSLPQLQNLVLSDNSFSGNIENVAMFAMQYPDYMQSVTDINISNNQFSGNIGVFAQAFPNLESLDASGNKIENVYPIISSKVSMLDLSSQKIERIIDIHLKNMNIETLASKIPTILLYNHNQQAYTSPVNLYCSTEDGWGMVLSYQNGQITIPYITEQNAYKGASGDTLAVSVLNAYGSPEGTTLSLKLEFDEGDANFNGSVDILDLQATINYMFEEYTNKPFNYTAANLWKDDVINVQDAVNLVNLLLETEVVYANNPLTRAVMYTTEADAYAYVQNGNLILNTSVPVSSFDLVISSDFHIDLSLLSEQYGLSYQMKEDGDNKRIIAYSLSGNTIPAGESIIGHVGKSHILNMKLSDSDANEIKISIEDSRTTGITDATSDYSLTVSHGQLILTFNYQVENVYWQLYSIDGKLICSDKAMLHDNLLFISLDKELDGLFIFKAIMDEKNAFSKKIQIVK